MYRDCSIQLSYAIKTFFKERTTHPDYRDCSIQLSYAIKTFFKRTHDPSRCIGIALSSLATQSKHFLKERTTHPDVSGFLSAGYLKTFFTTHDDCQLGYAIKTFFKERTTHPDVSGLPIQLSYATKTFFKRTHDPSRFIGLLYQIYGTIYRLQKYIFFQFLQPYF